ncbi:MAG: SprT family zinc-dependent metalloprotease [Burkholderiales bacterium]
MMQLLLDLMFAPPPLVDGDLRYVMLGGRVLSYRLRRAARRTIALTVDRNGLTASAPQWVSVSQVEAFIRAKSRWVIAKMEDQARRARPPFEWRVGAKLPLLGRPVSLALDPGAPVTRLAGEHLEIALAQTATVTAMRTAVLAFLKGHAGGVFRERVALVAARASRTPPPIRVSNARAQWGSCQPDGRVFLSWRLVHLDLPLVDYVVAHEIAHLEEMNHSPRFWRTVERIYPDWRAARRELREREHALPEL